MIMGERRAHTIIATDTFVKMGGEWKQVVSHGSAVARCGVFAGACNTPFLRLNKCVVPGLGHVRLPSEGKGHTFESCRVRQIFAYLSAP